MTFCSGIELNNIHLISVDFLYTLASELVLKIHNPLFVYIGPQDAHVEPKAGQCFGPSAKRLNEPLYDWSYWGSRPSVGGGGASPKNFVEPGL